MKLASTYCYLLEDLRDAYPGSLEETILTEIMANALDSGASTISCRCDPADSTMTVIDNGSGMQRRDLARFHNIASSTKVRGQGIGFAGVGIKLGLLICEEVLTETRRGKNHVASSWHMASRHRAPWKWIAAPGLVAERGTAVRLKLRNPLSPLLDGGFVEVTLRHHFQPLLDPAFDDFLAAHYAKGIAVDVNGRRLEKYRSRARAAGAVGNSLIATEKTVGRGLLVARRHRPSGRSTWPRDQHLRQSYSSRLGLAGHDTDHAGTDRRPDRSAGAGRLFDFEQGGFHSQRRARRNLSRFSQSDSTSRHLSNSPPGADAPPADEQAPPREVRPLQRDLAHLLEDLALDFPLLASSVERRAGGQKRLPLSGRGNEEAGQSFVAASIGALWQRATPIEPCRPERQARVGKSCGQRAGRRAQQQPQADIPLPGNNGARRPAQLGLDIQFEDRPDGADLGRLVESTVWANRAHPAYRRALAPRLDRLPYRPSPSRLALAPLAVEPSQQRAEFCLRFYALGRSDRQAIRRADE